MQVSVLASGSKGNAVYVEMDGCRLLLDAGISATRIKKALLAQGIDAASLDGVLITHEHRDHIAGLATLSKWYHLPIFSRRATFEHMSCRAMYLSGGFRVQIGGGDGGAVFDVA